MYIGDHRAAIPTFEGRSVESGGTGRVVRYYLTLFRELVVGRTIT
jgi:hypothetical protein